MSVPQSGQFSQHLPPPPPSFWEVARVVFSGADCPESFPHSFPGAAWPAAVLHLSDRDLLCAMAVSLCCSAAWRARTAIPARESPSGAAALNLVWQESVTVGDLRWAQCVREQARVFQGADVDRLLAETRFAGGAAARLASDWGAE